MNRQILIAASVGLSLFAAAQSQTDKQKPKPAPTSTVSPRDASSGQASGRIQHLHQDGVIHRDLAARDVATGQATGKKTAQDDWQQQNAVSGGSTTKGPRDVSTGQMSGKRQHQPVVVTKTTDQAPSN